MWSVLEQPVCQRATLVLIHFIWQGALIAAGLALALRLSRRSNASARYALSLAAMGLMAACPLVTFVVLAPAVILPAQPLGQAVGHDAPLAAGLLQPAQPYLLLAWLTGVSLLSVRLFASYAGTLWLRRGRLPLPETLAARASQLAHSLGVAAGRVFASARAREVIAVGFWRPVVLLPLAWLTAFPPDVIESAIAHELAHIRRWDLWVSLFQRWAETLLFYHPAVWWVSRQVNLSREMCCDELAAAAIGDRLVYANALDLVARQRVASPPLLAAAMMGEPKMKLLSRVRYVLGLNPANERASAWPLGVAAALLPAAIWAASLGAMSSAAPTARADNERGRGAAGAFQPQTQREAALYETIQQLQREMAELKRQVAELRGQRGTEGAARGETGRTVSRETGRAENPERFTTRRSAEGERDGRAGARDGEGVRRGPRDGEGGDKAGPRDGEGARRGPRDGEGERKSGERDGDRPREGGREGGGEARAR
jgi:beta-lactamase regulating signal transducer with metallopeptidase domain